MSYVIRPYSPDDRRAVRWICCETGFSGNPVDPLFCDRDVFADFFTRYYTDWEPEHSLVAEYDGEVIGYLNACFRYRYHSFVMAFLLPFLIIPKAGWRFLSGQYDQNSRVFLKWCCFNASKETPKAPKHSAHFHFNFLPEHRNTGAGIRLLRAFVKLLQEKQVSRVYGQIQTGNDRRPDRVFERFGFTLFDRRLITKFQRFHDRNVYVSTFIREMDQPGWE